MSLWIRLAAAMAALVLATAGVVGLVSYSNIQALVIPRVLQRMELHLRVAAQPLSAIVEKAAQDVAVAAAAGAVDGIVRAASNGGIDPQDRIPEATWRARLAALFQRQLAVEPRYLQFRLIGTAAGGREMVRVDRSVPQGEIRVVPEARLQSKEDRPYFQRAVTSARGEVIISAIELNQENGVIEEPATPVVRVALAIYAPDGSVFGALVINIDLRVVFAQMRAAYDRDGTIFVTNAAGDYLLSPEDSDNFAFQQGRSARLQDDYPAVADAIAARSATEGLVSDRSGLSFGFVLLPVTLAGVLPVFVAEAIPYDAVSAVAAASQRSILTGSLIAVVCAIGLALLLARTLARPIRQMTNAAYAIERGELPQLPTGFGGEIGILAQAFERMAQDIEEKKRSLSDALDAQKRANAELQARSKRERLLSAAVETSDDAIIIHDLDGQIIAWNRAAERLYGYSPEDIMGRTTEIIIPPERHDDFRDLLQRVRRGEAVSHVDTVRVTKDGRRVDVSISVSPVRDEAGHLIGASKIARDITNRKRGEAERAAFMADLKRSNAELEQFAYIAAHDLQEPLRMVASYTELLSERYKGQIDARADKYIGYAVDGAKRMKLLINDLLAFSRVGTQGKDFEPVDTDLIARKVIEGMDQAIIETGATVWMGDLPVIAGDDVQLGQLFQNLIGNAIKFRSDKPPYVRIAARREADDWVFSVSDNGIGMDPAYAERVFQMFQRLHERGRYDGSGIGLAIAKRIVERHRGRIWLESALGAGTTIFFSIPKNVAGSDDQ